MADVEAVLTAYDGQVEAAMAELDGATTALGAAVARVEAANAAIRAIHGRRMEALARGAELLAAARDRAATVQPGATAADLAGTGGVATGTGAAAPDLHASKPIAASINGRCLEVLVRARGGPLSPAKLAAEIRALESEVSERLSTASRMGRLMTPISLIVGVLVKHDNGKYSFVPDDPAVFATAPAGADPAADSGSVVASGRGSGVLAPRARSFQGRWMEVLAGDLERWWDVADVARAIGEHVTNVRKGMASTARLARVYVTPVSGLRGRVVKRERDGTFRFVLDGPAPGTPPETS
jgi:hypothetical protein